MNNTLSQYLNYLKIKLYSCIGEKYNMAGYHSNGCSHDNVYVKEIYEKEIIPINLEGESQNSIVDVATEYLTLMCFDCSKTWNGKRTIKKCVEMKIGNPSSGSTGFFPTYFTEINASECDHRKFNVDNNTINYMKLWDYCTHNLM